MNLPRKDLPGDQIGRQTSSATVFGLVITLTTVHTHRDYDVLFSAAARAPRNAPIDMPYVDSGHLIIAASACFFLVASYAILFSAFLPLSGLFVRHSPLSSCPTPMTSIQLLDVLANDTHYKYLIIFVIPVGFYFVIANWVGWQYYRNS